ncbi:MAG: HAD family hydrolase [Cyanobium sp.]
MSPESASGPLLMFDFDGVLVDGMPEYWWAARATALRLDPALELPEQAPAAFARLRPFIHKGWEMVLVASELDPGRRDRPEGSLVDAPDYAEALLPALERCGWSADRLQNELERVRDDALRSDAAAWLARHRFYPGVVERLERLAAEGSHWGVLTTKGGAFAAEILAAGGLKPHFLYGHEQGSKPEVLLRLRQQRRPLWFIEDRRPTLVSVRATPGLEAVRCFLATWGYLAPGDREGLAETGIHWLPVERFEAPLARWL